MLLRYLGDPHAIASPSVIGRRRIFGVLVEDFAAKIGQRTAALSESRYQTS